MALLGRFRRREVLPVEPAMPDGQRLYCIGDIHGRADLLAELQQLVRQDAEGFPGGLQLVYLGDYIDRGEGSKEVIEILSERPLDGFETTFLQGNHEQALLDFLADPVAMASWLEFGGLATLRSYGVTLPHIPRKKDLEYLRNQLDAYLPERHRQFFENCVLSHAAGSYYFAHAGVRPGLALEKQRIEDLLWIRDEFIHSKAHHGAIVVHGHSISEEPELRPNRIGIDTGAYYSGVLTALVLEGGEQRLLQTRGDAT